MEPGITIATDGAVADFIRSTQRELVVLAPAVTEGVAEAIANRWRSLGASAVQVIMTPIPKSTGLASATKRASGSSRSQHAS